MATTLPSRQNESTEHTRWNFGIIVAESTFFMSGLAWVDPAAVLPLFIARLTPSTVVIGAIAVLQQIGWKAPQIFMAAALGHRPHKLPFLRWPVLIGRLPFFVFVGYLWLRGVENSSVVIWFLAIALACISFGNGILGISWNDIIAKSIPPRLRGRFFGSMQFATAVAAFAVGFAVRWALGSSGPGFPLDYTLLFTAMAVFLFISVVGCWLVREPIRPVLDQPQSVRQLLLSTIPMLRDPPFRALVTAALLGFAVTYTLPFYVVYAKQHLGVEEHVSGVYIWAMTVGGAVASIFWGYLNDSRGPRAVMRGGAILATSTPLLALLLPAIMLPLAEHLPAAARALPYVFGLVFLTGGSAMGAMWMGSTNYLFDLCGHEDRPRYLAIFHLCTIPSALAALVVGWLLAYLSFTVIFFLLMVCGAAALAAALTMPHISREDQPTSPAAP
ncbi:MAG TPA: MFS transporter [Armatimonadota bacterium]|nr:MFS transporter [Armatimonadota bacterium]